MSVRSKSVAKNHKKIDSNSIIDVYLLVAIMVLISIGLLLVSSASMEKSAIYFGNPIYILIKQSIFLLVGLFCVLGILIIPIYKIEKLSWLMLVLAILLLVVVLLFGKSINGSVRWIYFGFFNIQPSELSKLFIIVYLSSYLVRRSKELRTQWKGFLKPLFILMLVSLLLLSEPDLGAVLVLMASCMGMIYLAGVKIEQFLVLTGLLALAVFVLILVEPYRMLRLIAFMDPWSDAYGSGYQLTQSLIGFGRGEWFGAGLGNSIQKLFYLPEAHTDFIFAILGEEFGVLGCALVILLYSFIFWRILRIGFSCESKGLIFHGYLAYGIGLLLIVQAFINIAVNLGLLPTKGLALPLISYGGSNLVVSCIALGLVLRIDYEQRSSNTSIVHSG